MKKYKDIHMAVEETTRLMALIHLLYFDKTQAFKTHVWKALSWLL